MNTFDSAIDYISGPILITVKRVVITTTIIWKSVGNVSLKSRSIVEKTHYYKIGAVSVPPDWVRS